MCGTRCMSVWVCVWVCVCQKTHDEINQVWYLTHCFSSQKSFRFVASFKILDFKQNFHFILMKKKKTVESSILRTCCINVRPKFRIVWKIYRNRTKTDWIFTGLFGNIWCKTIQVKMLKRLLIHLYFCMK